MKKNILLVFAISFALFSCSNKKKTISVDRIESTETNNAEDAPEEVAESVDWDNYVEHGQWEVKYLLDDFNEEMKDKPCIEVCLPVSSGLDNYLYIVYSEADMGPHFRISGIRSMQYLRIKTQNGAEFIYNFDNFYGDTGFIRHGISSLADILDEGDFKISVISKDYLHDTNRHTIVNARDNTTHFKDAVRDFINPSPTFYEGQINTDEYSEGSTDEYPEPDNYE